jgi:hypothetical protein
MKKQKRKGSALVVTLILMGVILVIALSISLRSIRERKAAMGGSKSAEAYQVAETGIEAIMNALLTGNAGATLGSISGYTCATNSNNHAVLTPTDGSTYKVELKKQTDTDATSCSNIIADIKDIKSVGMAGSQDQRIIEAAVAAGLTWNNATYQNSWHDFDDGSHSWYGASYALDSKTGLVYLRGTAGGGALDRCMFTLPSGYAPQKNNVFVVTNPSASGSDWLAVIPSGCVELLSSNGVSASNAWVYLNGIVFSIN